MKLNLRMTVMGQQAIVERLARQAEDRVCEQYLYTYKQYGNIVKKLCVDLIDLAKIQGYSIKELEDGIMPYMKNYNKQATAQKAIKKVVETFYTVMYNQIYLR